MCSEGLFNERSTAIYIGETRMRNVVNESGQQVGTG